MHQHDDRTGRARLEKVNVDGRGVNHANFLEAKPRGVGAQMPTSEAIAAPRTSSTCQITVAAGRHCHSRRTSAMLANSTLALRSTDFGRNCVHHRLHCLCAIRLCWRAKTDIGRRLTITAHPHQHGVAGSTVFDAQSYWSYSYFVRSIAATGTAIIGGCDERGGKTLPGA